MIDGCALGFKAGAETVKCVREGHLADSFMSSTFFEFYSNHFNEKAFSLNSPLTQTHQHANANMPVIPNCQRPIQFILDIIIF